MSTHEELVNLVLRWSAYSGLKHHTACMKEHERVGCITLDEGGRHWPCYKVQVASDAESSLPDPGLDPGSDSM